MKHFIFKGLTVLLLSIISFTPSVPDTEKESKLQYIDVCVGYPEKGSEDKICGEEYQTHERDINGNFWNRWWVDCEYKEWTKHHGWYEHHDGDMVYLRYGDYWTYEIKKVTELW